MDIITFLIGIAVFIISALLIYFISAFSMKEKTFEEVMEEQRRRNEEEREKVKAGKKAERELIKKKFKKGKTDKVKEKASSVTLSQDPALPKLDKMVNLEIEPEIIESTASLGLNTGVRQRGKKEKTVSSKPILHNKDEKTPVLEKAVELIHKGKPKDELELKKSHEERKLVKDTKSKHSLETKENIPPVSTGKLTKENVANSKSKENTPQPKPAKEIPQSKSKETIPQPKATKETPAPKSASIENVAPLKSPKANATPQKNKDIATTKGNKDNVALSKVAKENVSASKQTKEISPSQKQVKEQIVQVKVSKEQAVPLKSMKKEEPKQEKLMQTKQQTTESRSNKTKASDDVNINGSKLVSVVKTAKLSDNEVQTLIDILLNRQGLTPTGPIIDNNWNKKSQKGDPTLLLKKQLEEKERALQEEQNIAMSANAKVKEIKNELVVEKNKLSTMDRHYKEKIGQKQGEIDALQARMRQTHEQHMTESNNLQARLRQLEQGGDKAALQKLAAENKVLQDALNQRGKESVSTTDKLKTLQKELMLAANKIKTYETSKKTTESKLQVVEQKLKNMESSKNAADDKLKKRVDEVGNQLQKSESKNKNLTSDLQRATGALSSAQSEVTKLKSKLQELESHLKQAGETESKLQRSESKRTDLEGNVKNLEKQLADASKRIGEKEKEVSKLNQECHSLKEEYRVVNERLQSAPATNGEVHKSISMEEHDRLLSEKKSEVKDLTSNLENQKKTLMSLQSQMDSQTAEISDLNAQLVQQRAKNNELREKNWKAMEALEKSEKSCQEKIDRAFKSSRESLASGVSEMEAYDKSVFQRLFPDIKVGDKLPHKEWVTMFEKSAAKKISSGASQEHVKDLEESNRKLRQQVKEQEKNLAQATDTSKYDALDKENGRLSGELERYKQIVSETESKVKALEKSIDDEEKKWHERLRKAESSAKQVPSNSPKLKELEDTISKQKVQISEYRRILGLTEQKLQELESKATNTEQQWQKKLSSSETELSKAQGQLSVLKNEMSSSQGKEEMELKVENLEEELTNYRLLVSQITTEKETLVTKVVELEKQGENSESQTLKTEVTDLKGELAAERKKNKDLSLNVVKLNGIIKTGQDALSQEQNLVKKLQEQIDAKSVHSNVSDLEEVEQLRTKLSEKKKLLEREMAANKQLSERLAQLGVLAASSNDNGTSV